MISIICLEKPDTKVSFNDNGFIKSYTDQNGLFHRNENDLPAREYYAGNIKGNKTWFIHGRRHRLRNYATIESEGSKFWFRNDFRHRLNAPAIIRSSGNKSYWIFNQEIL